MAKTKRIHVNQHVIKSNVKNKENEPCITVKTYKSNDYGTKVDILDENDNIVASVVQRIDKPLSCGARVYVETKSKVKVNNKLID